MPRKNSVKRSSPRSQSAAQLRIIGGQWRSRRVPFPDVEGLRPTPDRVRETLFNWLQMAVPGARCLDLFTGSGALGLEALSRGATAVTFIDQSPAVIKQLKANLQLLKAPQHEVVQASALDWLRQQPEDLSVRYDVVFLDPPFHKGLVSEAVALLESKALLADNALIYIETESELRVLDLPAHWHEHRAKTAGQVTYRLFTRESAH